MDTKKAYNEMIEVLTMVDNFGLEFVKQNIAWYKFALSLENNNG